METPVNPMVRLQAARPDGRSESTPGEETAGCRRLKVYLPLTLASAAGILATPVDCSVGVAV